MKLTQMAALFGAFLAGIAMPCGGASSDEGLLRGITHLDPHVLPLDRDSAACGIDAKRVDQALREAMAQAPFGTDRGDYVLFVRLSSLPKHGDCFSSIDLGVYWEGGVPLPDSPAGVRAKVKLWENGTIIVTPTRLHWREVDGILKLLVGNLISAWRADNSKAG
ncbi:MAG: hypothetical protein JSU82_02580 [Rhodospirillales bacterium]|nr:MAG: hypothetical protein JSU82_02580 [Rhodospirillales bacterium]